MLGSLDKAYEAASAAAASSVSLPSVSAGQLQEDVPIQLVLSSVLRLFLPEPPSPHFLNFTTHSHASLLMQLLSLMKILYIQIRIRRLRLWAPMTNLARAML